MFSLLVVMAPLWAGVILGGSLIAAPAKFQAPSLTLPVALDVGRAQFQWLGYAEFGIAALILIYLLVSNARSRAPLVARFVLSLAVIALAVERFVVLPPLDERTQAIIAGVILPPSQLHLLFVAIEIAKLLLLLVASWSLAQKENTHAAL